MKGFSTSATHQRLSSHFWTCRQCLEHNRARHQQLTLRRPRSSNSALFKKQPRRSRPRAVALYASAGAATTLVASTLAFPDNVRHGYEAVERTGRVISTLFLCINDYRVTLNQNASTANEEDKAKYLADCHQRCANRTLKVLEKNGSIFIKLGQHLSAMNYLLPLEWTTTFIPLQDQCPVSSIESIEKMFKQDTGHPPSYYFSTFAHQPIGAASLAQVHLATDKGTGQQVAVKVQHPNIAEWIDLDLALTRFTFSTLKKWFPEYDLEWLSTEMEYSLPQELNFVLEGQNAMRAKQHFAKIPALPLVIPSVLWSKKRILVMENVSGHRPDDLEYLDSNHIDRDEVSAALSHIFNEMIFGHNAPLHCDPHGGNIAIRLNPHRRGANFDVILYDHGLYRDIPQSLRRSYAKLWLAVIDADEPRMRQYAKEVAGITDEQFPLFASTITGRDFTVLTQSATTSSSPLSGGVGVSAIRGGITAARSEEEKKSINAALGDGLLPQLVQLLGQVPRIILLILKTNDLTRSLDESLHTRLGPVRSFLILARYCARAVWEENLEHLKSSRAGHVERGNDRSAAGIPLTARLWWVNPNIWPQLCSAWWAYMRVSIKLETFETWLGLSRQARHMLDLIGGMSVTARA